MCDPSYIPKYRWANGAVWSLENPGDANIRQTPLRRYKGTGSKENEAAHMKKRLVRAACSSGLLALVCDTLVRDASLLPAAQTQ